MEERGEPHPEREARIGGRLHDLEGVLVDRQVVVAALLLEADRLLELGQQLDEHAGVAREPQRLRRLRAEQQLRELAHPVGGKPTADPLTRHEPDSGCLVTHLSQRFRVGLEAELRHEAQRTNEAERILGETRR